MRVVTRLSTKLINGLKKVKEVQKRVKGEKNPLILSSQSIPRRMKFGGETPILEEKYIFFYYSKEICFRINFFREQHDRKVKYDLPFQIYSSSMRLVQAFL